jgi:Ca2+/Na+ antiporter
MWVSGKRPPMTGSVIFILIIIIGIAVLITMLVTSNQTAHDEALRAKESDLVQQLKNK